MAKKYQPNQLNKLKEYYRKHPYYKLCKTVFKTFQEIYPTMVMTPEQLFVDASQTLDKLIQDGDLTTELCQELWTDKYNQYRERDKMAVSEDGTKTEVAMLFYVVMYGLQTINHSHYRGTLQRTLHDSIWKLYGQKECIDIEQRLRETVNQHTAEMLAWMKEYFVSEQSLSNEFGTVLHPPKQNKPKNTVERKYSGKPKTLRYLCNANNGHQNQRKERLKYVFQFWQAWKWIDANVKSEDFNSLFDGADRYCNFAFGKNITILTLFLQDLLTYKNREGCYIVEHQTNQSPSSIVKEQFNKTPNFDSKRLTDTDKQNIDLCIYTLDTANISSLDERNNEDWSYDNKELLQLVASWKINLDKQAEQEIVTGKLRSTKRI